MSASSFDVGDAAALGLQRSVAACAASPAWPLLERALAALAEQAFAEALAQAEEAARRDRLCVPAWRLMALALEGLGNLAGAVDAGQRAYELAPASTEILVDLARLAEALGEPAVAAQLLTEALAREPDSSALAALLAAALRDSHAHDRALQVLDGALKRDSGDARLWDELGVVRLRQGDIDAALTIFKHAADLDPTRAEPLYHRACAWLDLGDPSNALLDCAAALERARPDQTPAIQLVQAHARLSLSQLAAGWAAYEARHHPDFRGAPVFCLPASRWSPDQPLEGRRLLVMGEQGLGDEMMFSGMIADVIDALGPRGHLSLAVEPRLVPLFARAYPEARVSAHATTLHQGRAVRTAPQADTVADMWTPIGSLAQRFRPDLKSFSGRPSGLRADPDRVADWRRRLAALGEGPNIGLTWKSMKTGGDRAKQYAPFDAWRAILQTPDVRFVNLQYGQSADELAQARAWGVDIWTAPDLDLTGDMEGLAALAVSLDLTVGVANASSALAGACGAPLWLLASPSAWPRLGTGGYPWYGRSRTFVAERFGDWAPAASAVRQALDEWRAGWRPDVTRRG